MHNAQRTYRFWFWLHDDIAQCTSFTIQSKACIRCNLPQTRMKIKKKWKKKLRIPSQPSPIAPATRVKPNVQAVVRESSGPGQHAWDTWLTSLVGIGSFAAQLLQYLHSISLLLSCDIAVGTQNTLCKDQQVLSASFAHAAAQPLPSDRTWLQISILQRRCTISKVC